MNAAEIKAEVDACRRQWPVLGIEALPIDILSFLELDLGLDIIPEDGIPDAALAQDWRGIYVNRTAYAGLDRNPPSMTRRLRFTLAHEFAHWYLHRDRATVRSFRCIRDMLVCLRFGNNAEEWEANEFAGQLLVPAESLWECFNALNIRLDQMTPAARLRFCQKLKYRYGVNPAVIEIRLDREGIWPAI